MQILTEHQKHMRTAMLRDLQLVSNGRIHRFLLALQEELAEVQRRDYLNRTMFQPPLQRLVQYFRIWNDPQANITAGFLSQVKSKSDCYDVLLPTLREFYQRQAARAKRNAPQPAVNYQIVPKQTSQSRRASSQQRMDESGITSRDSQTKCQQPAQPANLIETIETRIKIKRSQILRQKVLVSEGKLRYIQIHRRISKQLLEFGLLRKEFAQLRNKRRVLELQSHRVRLATISSAPRYDVARAAVAVQKHAIALHTMRNALQDKVTRYRDALSQSVSVCHSVLQGSVYSSYRDRQIVAVQEMKIKLTLLRRLYLQRWLWADVQIKLRCNWVTFLQKQWLNSVVEEYKQIRVGPTYTRLQVLRQLLLLKIARLRSLTEILLLLE